MGADSDQNSQICPKSWTCRRGSHNFPTHVWEEGDKGRPRRTTEASMTSLDWGHPAGNSGCDTAQPLPTGCRGGKARSWQGCATWDPLTHLLWPQHLPWHPPARKGAKSHPSTHLPSPAPTCERADDDTGQDHGQHHVGRVCKEENPEPLHQSEFNLNVTLPHPAIKPPAQHGQGERTPLLGLSPSCFPGHSRWTCSRKEVSFWLTALLTTHV